jgi:hypothetical protein
VKVAVIDIWKSKVYWYKRHPAIIANNQNQETVAQS